MLKIKNGMLKMLVNEMERVERLSSDKMESSLNTIWIDVLVFEDEEICFFDVVSIIVFNNTLFPSDALPSTPPECCPIWYDLDRIRSNLMNERQLDPQISCQQFLSFLSIHPSLPNSFIFIEH